MSDLYTTPIASCSRCGASWAMPRDEPHACAVAAVEAERDRYRDALQLIASPNRATYEQPLDAWTIAMNALHPEA